MLLHEGSVLFLSQARMVMQGNVTIVAKRSPGDNMTWLIVMIIFIVIAETLHREIGARRFDMYYVLFFLGVLMWPYGTG